MDTLIVVRNRVPHFGDTYVLDRATKDQITSVPNRAFASPKVFIGCAPEELHPPEQNTSQKRATVELLTGLRGAQFDGYQVKLMETKSPEDVEVPGWWVEPDHHP